MTSTFLSILPKLPMTDLQSTKDFYQKLDFRISAEHNDYLIIEKDNIEIHFFLFPDLQPITNYGMCYIRVLGIEGIYDSMIKAELKLASLGMLETNERGQKEFSIIDNNFNLITFGEPIES